MGACPSLPNVVPAEVPAPVCAGCCVCGKSMTTTAPLGFCCRVGAGQFGRPLVPLGAWSEYRGGTGPTTGSGPTRTPRRSRSVRGASPNWSGTSMAGRPAQAPGWPSPGDDLALLTTVPFSWHPGAAPAERSVDGVPLLASHHLRLLGRAPGSGGHLRADRAAFALAPGVDRAGLVGLSVLLFDDTTTTGAAVQSAADTLRLAGDRGPGDGSCTGAA